MPGFSLMIRKRRTPSVIFRLWSRRSSSSLSFASNWKRWYSASGRWSISNVILRWPQSWTPIMRAAGLDRLLDVREDRAAALLRGLRIEQQHEVVKPCHAAA